MSQAVGQQLGHHPRADVSLGLDGFAYRDGCLMAGEVDLSEVAAAVGTPTYVYSADGLRAAYERVRSAFAPLGAHPHYAVKACANLHVCRLLRQLGAGMDVVSGGELERAWLAGTPMADICFAGVGKRDAEIRAALDGRHSSLLHEAERFGITGTAERGSVGMFNIESESELERIAAIAAELAVVARVCVRFNPNVDARTHEFTTTGKEENKFGIDREQILHLFERFAGVGAVDLIGLHVHIGSPVKEVEPFIAATQALLDLSEQLESEGHTISVLDLGGGWPIDYAEGEAPPLTAYAEALAPLLKGPAERGVRLLIEPGRSIVANAGVLLTRVQHLKQGRSKRFVICDAGMHTLIRPAFYSAFHFVWPLVVEPQHLPPRRAEKLDLPGLRRSEVVGPICESSDFLARDRELPPIERGDLLAVFSAGAYGMSITSNYNDHGRPAEVMIDGGEVTVINERQSLAGVLEGELGGRVVGL